MKKTIKNEKVIDPNRVSNTCITYAKYNVDYFIYHDAGKARRPCRPLNPVKEFGAVKLSGSCFSGLLHRVSIPVTKEGEKVIPNRVCYQLKWPEEGFSFVLLSTEERTEWVKLCKKYKLLPSYVTIDTAKDGILVLKLTATLPPALLYCYLSAFRCLREQTGFVQSMLYLVKELNMNFYAAFVLASYVTVCPSGGIHHIGEWCRSYMDKKSHVSEVAIPARDIVALKRFISNPAGFDARTVYTADKSRWHCKTHIKLAEKEYTSKKTFTAAELLCSKVEKLLKLQ
jgi:hypothetical protein